jgi:hydrogenase expression/formation protein HypD
MRHLDEYRQPAILEALRRELAAMRPSPANLMEVCGTHTMSAARFGLRQALPLGVELLSGPGCPVCVTPTCEIDRCLLAAGIPDVILTTFGDMLRVPGSRSSLERERARGADVRVVYSPSDAVALARGNPGRQIIFFGVGFETTAPTVAMALIEAQEIGVENFSILCAHRLIPPALRALALAGEANVGGFVLPGHVSTITGTQPYEFLAREHGMPCVVTGFEPTDLLRGVLMLLRQREEGRAEVEIEYSRVVKPQGNPRAHAVMERAFQVCDAGWRGLGRIEDSGLRLGEAFSRLDAARRFDLPMPDSEDPAGCRCGEVLRGVVRPPECGLFGQACTPEHPVGPCMVSSEGTCAAYYKYPAAEPAP